MTVDPSHWPASASKERKLPWNCVKLATQCRQVQASKCGTTRESAREHSVLPVFGFRSESVLVGRSEDVVVVVHHGPPRLRLQAFQRNLLLDRVVPRKSGTPQKKHSPFREFQID